jgi:hypothetical protein
LGFGAFIRISKFDPKPEVSGPSPKSERGVEIIFHQLGFDNWALVLLSGFQNSIPSPKYRVQIPNPKGVSKLLFTNWDLTIGLWCFYPDFKIRIWILLFGTCYFELDTASHPIL